MNGLICIDCSSIPLSTMYSSSCFSHIHYTPYTIPLLHDFKGTIDLIQGLPMRNKLVDLELPCHIVVHKVWQLCASLDTSECTALPLAASDELKG